MSDAPERIFVDWAADESYVSMRWSGEHPADGGTEYTRADLAGLPDELIKRIRHIRSSALENRKVPIRIGLLLNDILSWHEATKS